MGLVPSTASDSDRKTSAVCRRAQQAVEQWDVHVPPSQQRERQEDQEADLDRHEPDREVGVLDHPASRVDGQEGDRRERQRKVSKDRL